MTYDIYDTATGNLLAEDWPISAAKEAEVSGYHGVPSGRITAIEHGATPPDITGY